MLLRLNHLLPQPQSLFQLHSSPQPLLNPNPYHHRPCKHSKTRTPLALAKHHLPNLPHLQESPSSDSGRRFREKLDYLEKTLNVAPSKALSRNPNFRSAPIDAVKSVEKCLCSMGIEHSAIGRILEMYPQLLTSDPYLDLYPVFDFLLNDVKIPFTDVRKSIIRCPRLLICNVDDQLRRTFWFLQDFGFSGRNALTCHTTLLLVSSVEGTLVPKIEYLERLGLSRREVVTMVLRSPGLLTFSIQNNLHPKVEYFFEEMKGELLELKKFPQYFSFSLERKIIPRHRLLMERRLSLPLSDMLKVGDADFIARLIDLQTGSVEGRHFVQQRGPLAAVSVGVSEEVRRVTRGVTRREKFVL